MSEKPTASKPCCNVWPLVVLHLRWYTFDKWPDRRSMPYIGGSPAGFRVNYCPSCGAQRRGVVEERTP